LDRVCPDWSGGLAFAIAKSEAQARKLILKERGFPVRDWGDLEVRNVNLAVARCVSGGG